MDTPTQNPNSLSVELMQSLDTLPREDRLNALARQLEMPPDQALEQLARHSGLPRRDDVELDRDALTHIPVRVLSEYKCLPQWV